MIDMDYIGGYYPPQIAKNPAFQKHLLKEYVELLALSHMASLPYIDKMSFIGGTNLRLLKGIHRFSEDLDFDCKELTESEFMDMTDSVIDFLQMAGLNAEPKDKPNPKLTAFRRSIYFPKLLFDLSLTGHKEERFLLKVEAQDQGIPYEREFLQVDRCGFFFTVPSPPESILLSMKLSALLTRAKGRDFFDCLFLMQRTQPSYEFLAMRDRISTPAELKEVLIKKLDGVDLEHKKKDFEHLLFNIADQNKILGFREALERHIV